MPMANSMIGRPSKIRRRPKLRQKLKNRLTTDLITKVKQLRPVKTKLLKLKKLKNLLRQLRQMKLRMKLLKNQKCHLPHHLPPLKELLKLLIQVMRHLLPLPLPVEESLSRNLKQLNHPPPNLSQNHNQNQKPSLRLKPLQIKKPQPTALLTPLLKIQKALIKKPQPENNQPPDKKARPTKPKRNPNQNTHLIRTET